MLSTELRSSGSEFHDVGPAQTNARPPYRSKNLLCFTVEHLKTKHYSTENHCNGEIIDMYHRHTCRRVPFKATLYKVPLDPRYVIELVRRMTNVNSQTGSRQISAITTAAVTSSRRNTSILPRPSVSSHC